MDKIKKYIGAVILGSAMLTVPSCSDTWDEHYAPDKASTSATKSLWDLISENPDLSRFKAIAEKASYYRDETHPQADYTFKDMLDGSLLISVWAPENSAFTDAEYQQWLNMAETRGYTVQQQLMANSISLWRQVGTGGGVDTLTMMNGKKVVFDKDKFTMSNIPLNLKNVAATNGTLHTVRKALPFQYNLYEYLKDGENAAAKNLTLFHEYLVAQDTTYFSETSSIEGNPDINGNPTYVDSVYFTTNQMLHQSKRFPTNTNTDQYLTFDESFGDNIQGEDSAFVMILPTDAAWQAAYQKLEGLYNYANIYLDKDQVNTSGTKASSLQFLPVDKSQLNADSLKEKNIKMDLISPICFNVNIQPNAGGQKGRWTMDAFLAEKGASAEYFINTYGDTLRTDETWDKTSLLEGTQVAVSNGVGIVANEWKFPHKFYKPDVLVEVGYQSLFNTGEAVGTAYNVGFSNASASAWIDSTGRVSHDNFYYIYPPTATGSPKFEFKLVGTDGENRESEVMSGKYDIGIVMVPNYYMISTDSIIYTFGANGNATVVNGDIIPLKHKIQGILSYCDNKGSKDATATSEFFEYSGEKVDTLWLFTDFQFPYTYKNLRKTYPSIQLTSKTTSAERKNGYSNDFCIDRIILRSKED